jgi:CDP-diglyceride synthetase
VVINETLAKQFWPTSDPLNDHIIIGQSPRQIIGIVGDVHVRLNRDPLPNMYVLFVSGDPTLQIPWAWVIRTRGAPMSLSSAIQNELREASGGLPVARVRTMEEILSRSTAAENFNALALTIFVPKMCDTGAYFTGRLLGRHKMTPVLSPKKTWEGAAGGLLLAVVAAVGASYYGNQPQYFAAKAVAFALTVGPAGMFGDLAESLMKREGQKKDASQSVPGFGGVLDVIDSVLFAAPLSFLWHWDFIRASDLGPKRKLSG